MGRIVQDVGDLRLRERIDEGILEQSLVVIESSLTFQATIDEDSLWTEFGETLLNPLGYRADTTIIKSDNTSITASYAL